MGIIYYIIQTEKLANKVTFDGVSQSSTILDYIYVIPVSLESLEWVLHYLTMLVIPGIADLLKQGQITLNLSH